MDQNFDVPLFDPSLNDSTQFPNLYGDGSRDGGSRDGGRRVGLPPLPPRSSIPPMSSYPQNHFSNDGGEGGKRAGMPPPSPWSTFPPMSSYFHGHFSSDGDDGGRRAGMPPPTPRSSFPPVSPYSFTNISIDGDRRVGMPPPPSRSALPPVSPYSRFATVRQQKGSQSLSHIRGVSRSLSQSSPDYSLDDSLPPFSKPLPSAAVENKYRSLPRTPYRMSNSNSGESSRKAHRRARSDFSFGQLIYPKPSELLVGEEKEAKEEGEESMDELLSSFGNFDARESDGEESRGGKKKQKNGSEGKDITNVAASNSSPRSVPVDSYFDMKSSIAEDSHQKLRPFFPEPDNKLTGYELDKISYDQKLLEIAASDPKRVKRILSNRCSAARSKERKERHMADLENQVANLQNQKTALTTQFSNAQKERMALMAQRKDLMIRIEGMEKQAKLRDDLVEYLTGEVQRLKVARGEVGHYRSQCGSLNMQPFNA